MSRFSQTNKDFKRAEKEYESRRYPTGPVGRHISTVSWKIRRKNHLNNYTKGMFTSARREQLQLLQLQFLFLLFPPFSIFNILLKRLHTIDNVIFEPNYLQ